LELKAFCERCLRFMRIVTLVKFVVSSNGVVGHWNFSGTHWSFECFVNNKTKFVKFVTLVKMSKLFCYILEQCF